MGLESRRHSQEGPPDQRLARVATPLCLQAWESKLKRHPDRQYVRYILGGIEHGFCIGVDNVAQCKSASQNMQSATQNPQVIEENIKKEVAVGNILGPFSSCTGPKVHINRFGVIPKKHQPGKWRLITDLSFPEGLSVNDAINPDLCSLSYITVDQVAHKAIELGVGAVMAKIDIKSAYRLIPVWPHDRKWLGMEWNGSTYVDGMLPFGLRSAPKIFNAVADAMEWCIAQEGVEYIFHYLDDFAIVAPPESDLCRLWLCILKRVCAELGVPLAPEKQDGPTTVMQLLGITIDTVRQELRLPEEKLKRLLETLNQWESKKSCSRKELESLIGILQHACKVIRPGRAFLRQVISLLTVAKQPHHRIRLNAGFRADIMLWKTFAAHWNGAALVIHPTCRQVGCIRFMGLWSMARPQVVPSSMGCPNPGAKHCH